MNATASTLILILAPLAAAAWGGCRPRHARLATLMALGLSALTAVWLWVEMPAATPPLLVDWLPGITGAQLGLQWDALALSMATLVSVVALLVGVFSIYYMQGQPARYWSYLGIFTSSMLGLALSPNLLQLFICWELVGFSSFLLIGYYRTAEASEAAPLAFWTNRVGDAGLLAGVLLLWLQQGHTGWAGMPGTTGTLAPLLLFCGTLAKSAQFPLQVWLPAAMAGPTPASALIHAATMVAAGVFLLVRAFPAFSADALQLVAWVGALTALMAAIAALRQTDLKRLLAFSTISQLGYMVAAVGLGAWQAAYFHLLTHALFKAALFLGAGVLIHELGHAWHGDRNPQDMRHMGGLARRLPVTAASMTVAAAALAGVPLTAGFLSKEAILTQAWVATPPLLFGVLLLGAVVTAAYALGMVWQVFFRPNPTAPQVQESGWAVRLPLILLGMGSLWFAFGVNPLDAGHSWPLAMLQLQLPHLTLPLLLGIGAVGVGMLAGLFLRKKDLSRLPLDAWHTATLHFYRHIVARGLQHLSHLLARFDRQGIDGTVHMAAQLVAAQAHSPGAVQAATHAPLSLASAATEAEAALTRADDQQARQARSLALFAATTDHKIVDGAVLRVGKTLRQAGQGLRHAQSGRSQRYFILTLLLLVSLLLIAVLL